MLLKRETASCVLMSALSVACFAYARKRTGQISISVPILTTIMVNYLKLHAHFIEVHLTDGGVSIFVRNEWWHELSSHALTYHPQERERALKPSRNKNTSRGVAYTPDVIHALETVQAYGTTTGQYRLSFEFTKSNLRKLIAGIDKKLNTRH